MAVDAPLQDEAAPGEERLPKGLFGFIILLGGWHQLSIATLATMAFLCGTIPLEIQRRIVNAAVDRASLGSLVVLVLAYFAFAFAEGAVKLALNLYRSWIGEAAIRWLRTLFLMKAGLTGEGGRDSALEGVELSIVLAEAEPVGGFVGTSISEPLLQAGILAAVTGYMIFLQPLMTLVVAFTFFPQIGFVPVMQGAINRRVESKINVMRQVSEGMVETFGDGNAPDGQESRVGAVFAANMSIYRYKFVMNFMMNLMTQLGYAGIFLLGGYYVLKGRIEMGTVVAFVSGLSKITDPWGEVVDWYRDLKVTQVKYRLIRDAAGVVGSEMLQAARPTLRL
jgi:ABC-type multidrug transport system fused ATPase/permease subunit